MDRLTNFEMADREILHIVNDCTNGNGWAPREAIERKLRLSHPDPARCIASRFSWMIRWGWLIKEKDEAAYRVTKIGADLMRGDIDKALAATLKSLSAGERVVMIRHLGQSYQRSGRAAQIMMRRQWQHNTHRRR